MAQQRFTVTVHDEGEGQLWAEVVELPGCFAAGATLEELNESLREGLGLYLHDNPDAIKVLDIGHVEERTATEHILVEV
jgi:predicted RNase H-like HicB family nuclease